MAPMAGAPVSLRNTLQAMLAQSPSLRPPAISFAAAGYFQVPPPPNSQSQGRAGQAELLWYTEKYLEVGTGI